MASPQEYTLADSLSKSLMDRIEKVHDRCSRGELTIREGYLMLSAMYDVSFPFITHDARDIVGQILPAWKSKAEEDDSISVMLEAKKHNHKPKMAAAMEF